MGEIRVKTADGWQALPSHQKTSTGWKDIPTHTMTATGWQGELTSQSPLEFRATGQSLLDWRVDGKTSGNLFDISSDIHGYINSSGNFVPNNSYTATDYIEIPPNARTLYCSAITKSGQPVYTGLHVAVYDENKTLLTYDMDYNKSKISMSVDISMGKYFRADVCGEDYTECMVSLENVPYEPYGGVGDWDETEQKYVIPVTVGGVTTNLYTTTPLMDGDSLDFATDQTSIPITQGDNTLTVGTQVQPKSVFVKFEG